MQISACIICKNEEQYIGKCIQALRALPVHIVAADTGSTDNTLSILEKLLTSNDTLCHFEWCNDFSMARNFCAIQAQTDWIWMVDADEILTSCDSVVLHDFLEKKENVDKIGTILRKDAYPLQGEIAFATSRMGRIYNRNYYHYEGIIHEQLTPCNRFTDSSDTALQEICYVDLPLFLIIWVMKQWKHCEKNASAIFLYWRLLLQLTKILIWLTSSDRLTQPSESIKLPFITLKVD